MLSPDRMPYFKQTPLKSYTFVLLMTFLPYDSFNNFEADFCLTIAYNIEI